ncbi:hypothetical protein PV10_05463 [Exophiala mesophila]|uniref:Uncharacterized protein n=1 Tax=Exophiala mesophila TaxID=212818 RepID=A0A0D1Z7U0_EXOME|nr:uncharacterized protein PV10_05463 [Exophiala mesophila]KIV90857.1 hypothetical protein PV10_05463 [Exophiala mesophila]
MAKSLMNRGISLITLGKSFDLVHDGQDKHNFLSALHQSLLYGANVGVCSELHWYLGKLMSYVSNSGVDWMVNFVSTQFQERIAQVGYQNLADAKEKDFLGTTLRLHTQQPDKIGLKDVFGMSLQNIGAGSDATSVSLAGIMYHLITHPHYMQRLREEIDEAPAQGKISELTIFTEAQ